MPTATSTDRFGSRSLSQIVFRVESGCMEFATFACNLDDASDAASLRIGVTRAEYVSLHPSSSMKLCDSQNSTYPIRIDPKYNIAFTVPAGNWATQTVADDAKSFFRYSAPAVTTPPATTTATPAATSASFLSSLTTSVVAGLGAVFLVL
ncbi:hypothetical protein SPRG_15700 [Saprolegnia parasitica CBS 223.65]|uniref:Uncharacterized protein n=1 Tax=Saprolegnia parasitica (strain CBS 223.65) TaxID=695850 RepID=A0A067BW93_SAPPC|nr:hypothetical protein SPRG_15700 [Saprolegnia parasitica CBS 223.65]KDO18872.1 hypothetical protein SPRG_15700 [Saprolegnia parasitica CBS 223.65]|eukprot:XP_012210426.1 hypothetical protein SPRG_15700 [Saprolegnia parasitica CBS 223.65]